MNVGTKERVLKRQNRVGEAALQKYLDHIKEDYANWQNRSVGRRDELGLRIRDEMIKEFNNNLTYEIGNKYIKIIKGGHGQQSVHSFIVNHENDHQFLLGDVLKAASWNAPARNKARGNIRVGNYGASWTGAHYL